jgi:hypothetical protein
MHTVTLVERYDINVDALINLAKYKQVVRKKLSTLEVDKLQRSKNSGFSKKRYEKTDIRYPVLIDQYNTVLDGRHRLCKLLDMGRKTVRCVVMSEHEIRRCRIIQYGGKSKKIG